MQKWDMCMIQEADGLYCAVSDVDAALAAKDAEIAKLNNALMDVMLMSGLDGNVEKCIEIAREALKGGK